MVERAAAADMSSRIFKAALDNGRFASRERFSFIVVFISGPCKSRTHAQGMRRRRRAGTRLGDCGLHGDGRRERDFCKNVERDEQQRREGAGGRTWEKTFNCQKSIAANCHFEQAGQYGRQKQKLES